MMHHPKFLNISQISDIVDLHTHPASIQSRMVVFITMCP